MAEMERGNTAQAKEIINQLSIALRTGQFHNIENNAVLEALIKLRDSANQFIRAEGFLRIDLAGDFFYVNDVRIRYPLEYLVNFDYLTEQLRAKDIGSIGFLAVMETSGVKKFLSAFLSTAGSADPFEEMVQLLDDEANIVIERTKKVKRDEDLNRRKAVKKTYFTAVSVCKSIMTAVPTDEKMQMKKAKRVVESMVDAVLEEEQLLIGMTAIKDYDEYTYHHSVNVSILSIAMGQRLGMSRKNITILGIAALFHDIGKTMIPRDILNKPASFTEEEWEVVRRHPYLGALALLKIKGIDEISMQSAIAAFQHHLNCDLSGYPRLKHPMALTFCARIISIADQYDAMTSCRVYNRRAMPPDAALGELADKSNSAIDPVLLKLFINMVGRYPIGALVSLDTGEMGLVCEGTYSSPERPKVMIIMDGAGNHIAGHVTDLTETDTSGSYLRSVAKTLDPSEYKVSLAEYLL